eukprot:jgi/Botrbrau1/13418/Bobra.0082s0024.1
MFPCRCPRQRDDYNVLASLWFMLARLPSVARHCAGPASTLQSGVQTDIIAVKTFKRVCGHAFEQSFLSLAIFCGSSMLVPVCVLKHGHRRSCNKS